MKRIFFIILLSSFLLSLLFLIGRIDQDYFSFYYIGRGVASGANMYQDFANNKGPIFYSLFVVLSLVFSSSYIFSLVFLSTLIDTLAIFFLFLLLKKRYDFENLKTKYFLVAFAVLYYKSFSIGMFMGGVYSETLAMMFVLMSIYFMQVKNYYISGFLFCLGVLSRQTVIFWFIYLFFMLYKQQDGKNKIVKLMASILATLSLVSFIFLINGSLRSLIFNTIITNLAYASEVVGVSAGNILLVGLHETRIFLSLLFGLFCVFYSLRSNNKHAKDVFVLFVTGFFATFIGGIFYFHHFLSFAPVFIIFFVIFLPLYSKKAICFGFLMFFSLFVNYYFYVNTSNIFSNDDIEYIAKASNKKFIQVAPNYPEIYIQTNKNSFDKNYHIVYLSSFFYKKPGVNVSNHLHKLKDAESQTTFVFVNRGDLDSIMLDEYIDSLGRKYKLAKISEKIDAKKTISIYEIEE